MTHWRSIARAAVGALSVACVAQPIPSPSVSLDPSAIASGWQLVPLGDLRRPGSMTDLVLVDGSLVALGSVADRPVAWSSVDGVEWVAEELAGQHVAPMASTVWGRSIVVVGGGEAGKCAHPFALTTWVRGETARWTAAPFDPIFCAGGIPLVAAHGDRAMIVGTGSGDVNYAWTSLNGLRWAIVPGLLPVGTLRAVTAHPAGGFLVASSAFGERPVVSHWDGEGDLRSANFLPAPVNSVPLAAVATEGEVLLALSDEGGRVGLIGSVDGAGWSGIVAVGLETATLARIVRAPPFVVAIGGDATGPGLWVAREADLTVWRAIPLPTEAEPSFVGGVAVLGDRAVLVGTVEEAAEAVPAVWLGPASLLEP